MVKKGYVLICINILLSINEHRGQKKYTPIKKISTDYLLSNNPTFKLEKKIRLETKCLIKSQNNGLMDVQWGGS